MAVHINFEYLGASAYADCVNNLLKNIFSQEYNNYSSSKFKKAERESHTFLAMIKNICKIE